MNIIIMLTIILANAIAISILYQFVKRLDKRDKLIFIGSCVAIVYILITIVYWISGFGIDEKIHEECKSFVTYMFVPVDVILFMPFVAYNYMKYKDKKIKKEELIKKIVIILLVGVVVLIGEYFYFKNIQHNVKQIGINVENTQNTNTENEEQTINNTNIQLNEQINTINTNTQINEQY